MSTDWHRAMFGPNDADPNVQVEADRAKAGASWRSTIDNLGPPSISFAGDRDSDMGRRALAQPGMQQTMALAEVQQAGEELKRARGRGARTLAIAQANYAAALKRMHALPLTPVERPAQSAPAAGAWTPDMPWAPSATYPHPGNPQ